MSYIIKDKKNDCWLLIDRIVRDMDIVTTVENVYNYKAATKFSDLQLVKSIIEQIKQEGNYDVGSYTEENVEALEKALEEQQELKEELDGSKC